MTNNNITKEVYEALNTKYTLQNIL